MAGNLIQHTFLDKFLSYILSPINSASGMFYLVLIILNMIILKLLKRRNKYVNFFMINVSLISITILICGISAFLVSRLGLHGGVRIDDCDKSYIIWAKITYGITVMINTISIVTILIQWYKDKKKEKEYFSSEHKESYDSDDENKYSETVSKKNIKLDLNIDGVKEKANDIKDVIANKVEQIKEMIDNKNK